MNYGKFKIGPWLKEWAKENRKSTHWLAIKLNVSERTILNFYQEAEIGFQHLRKISEITGTDVFLFYLSEESYSIYIEAQNAAKAEAEIAALSTPERLTLQDQINDLKMEFELLKELLMKGDAA